MRARKTFAHTGYTLMEVVVATAISLILLAAVYTTFFLFMRQTRSGREVANQANVARAIFTQITEDVSGHLAPMDPRLVRLPDGVYQTEEDAAEETSTTGVTSTSSSSTGSSTSSTTGSSNNGNTGSNPSSAASSGGSSQTQEDLPAVGPAIFNMGVQGWPEQVVLFVTRPPGVGIAGQMMKPDLRRISYWIVQGPDGPLGLARQEVDLPTSDQTAFQANNPEQFIFARGVVAIQFEYFDGAEWLPEWDGNLAFDVSGKTLPQGPPAAIAVTVVFAEPGAVNVQGVTPTRQFRHVIALPCANGPVDPQAAAGGLQP